MARKIPYPIELRRRGKEFCRFLVLPEIFDFWGVFGGSRTGTPRKRIGETGGGWRAGADHAILSGLAQVPVVPIVVTLTIRRVCVKIRLGQSLRDVGVSTAPWTF
jgi:hypothetical protein